MGRRGYLYIRSNVCQAVSYKHAFQINGDGLVVFGILYIAVNYFAREYRDIPPLDLVRESVNRYTRCDERGGGPTAYDSPAMWKGLALN